MALPESYQDYISISCGYFNAKTFYGGEKRIVTVSKKMREIMAQKNA